MIPTNPFDFFLAFGPSDMFEIHVRICSNHIVILLLVHWDDLLRFHLEAIHVDTDQVRVCLGRPRPEMFHNLESSRII